MISFSIAVAIYCCVFVAAAIFHNKIYIFKRMSCLYQYHSSHRSLYIFNMIKVPFTASICLSDTYNNRTTKTFGDEKIRKKNIIKADEKWHFIDKI